MKDFLPALQWILHLLSHPLADLPTPSFIDLPQVDCESEGRSPETNDEVKVYFFYKVQRKLTS